MQPTPPIAGHTLELKNLATVEPEKKPLLFKVRNVKESSREDTLLRMRIGQAVMCVSMVTFYCMTIITISNPILLVDENNKKGEIALLVISPLSMVISMMGCVILHGNIKRMEKEDQNQPNTPVQTT